MVTSFSFQYPLKSLTLSLASYLFTDVEPHDTKNNEQIKNKQKKLLIFIKQFLQFLYIIYLFCYNEYI